MRRLSYIEQVLQFMDHLSRNFPDVLRAHVVLSLANQFWSVLFRLLALCTFLEQESKRGLSDGNQAQHALSPDILAFFKLLKSSTQRLERTFNASSGTLSAGVSSSNL
jgi:hypothetical protein